MRLVSPAAPLALARSQWPTCRLLALHSPCLQLLLPPPCPLSQVWRGIAAISTQVTVKDFSINQSSLEQVSIQPSYGLVVTLPLSLSGDSAFCWHQFNMYNELTSNYALLNRVVMFCLFQVFINLSNSQEEEITSDKNITGIRLSTLERQYSQRTQMDSPTNIMTKF